MVWLLALWLGVQGYEDLLAAGIAALEEGRLAEAEASFREASELARDESAPRVLLAEVLLETGRPRLALDNLQAVRGPAASDGRILYLRGRALIGLGRYDAAILELQTALEKLEDDAACREALALARLESGDPEGAVAELEPLWQATDEHSPSLAATYGIALAQAGRHQESIEPLRAALADQPRRSRALFHLGRALQSLEHFDEAADVYRQGLDFRPPENIRFALGLARCQIRLGRTDEARAHLNALVERHPRVGRAWLLRGVVAFEEGRYQDSIRDVEKAIELGYRLPEADLRLGMALGLAGRYDEAQRTLDRALSREPELAAAYYYKGLFLFQEGEALSDGGDNPFGIHAVRLLERSASLVPNPQTSLALSEAYLRLGQHQRAMEQAREAKGVPELRARAYHLMALAHHELLEYESAEEAYRKAFEAGADSAEVFHDWGNLLSVMGRWGEAKEALAGALERDRELGGALLQMGIVELNLGEHDKALETLSRAVQKTPRNAEAWYQKGIVESREGNPEAAVASWKTALSLDPDQTRLYYRLAAELVKLDRLEERNALLEEFQKRERESEAASDRDEQLQNLLQGAVAASDRGEDERAQALLEEARRLAPQDPLPIVYLGDFLLSRGRLEEAEATLRAGLEKLPEELSLYQTLLSVQQSAGDGDAADETRKKIRELVRSSEP